MKRVPPELGSEAETVALARNGNQICAIPARE